MKSRLPLLFAALFICHTAMAGDELTLSLPPASLAQWYKPQNKRQVWLHTMFRLRREMLAVADYAAQKDRDNLRKWTERLLKDYRSLADMVPEWKDELALDWADRLEQAVAQTDFAQVEHVRERLENSCGACHRKFLTVTALRYRAPSYDALEIADGSGGKQSYTQLMQALSDAVNRIKIGSEDGHPDSARAAMAQLQSRLRDLGQSCPQCHADEAPHERILGQPSQRILAALDGSIRDQRTEDTDKLLGEIGVAICARCHGVHRTLAELKELLEP